MSWLVLLLALGAFAAFWLALLTKGAKRGRLSPEDLRRQLRRTGIWFALGAVVALIGMTAKSSEIAAIGLTAVIMSALFAAVLLVARRLHA